MKLFRCQLLGRIIEQNYRNVCTSTSLLTYHKNMESDKTPFPTPQRWMKKNEFMKFPEAPGGLKPRAVYYHAR